jgi:phosphoglycolate phosphatase
MTRVALAVFDFDGTLVDSQHDIVASMVAAFAAEGLTPPDPAAIRSSIGLPLDRAISGFAPGVAGLQLERVVTAYRDHQRGKLRGSQPVEPLIPGALAALDRLESDGVHLAIATGKGRRGLLHVLETHGLADRFVSLQTPDTAPGKPDPTMLRQAIAVAGAEPRDTVMIGDTVFDLQMASNAGVASIAVSWGYHDVTNLRRAAPNAVIDHFDELFDAFRMLVPLSGG